MIFDASQWAQQWNDVAKLTDGITKEDPRFERILEYLDAMDEMYRNGSSMACGFFLLLKRKIEKGVRMSAEEVERWAVRRKGN